MMLTEAVYDRLATDAQLVALLADYRGGPAIFTIDPAPGDAVLPYIVSAGEVSHAPADTKTTRGREILRDVRCYAPDDGTALTVEAIAERVRALLHRHRLEVDGYQTYIADVSGPIAANEERAYGRIVSVRLWLEQSEEGS